MVQSILWNLCHTMNRCKVAYFRSMYDTGFKVLSMKIKYFAPFKHKHKHQNLAHENQLPRIPSVQGPWKLATWPLCSDHGQPRYQIWIKCDKRQMTSCVFLWKTSWLLWSEHAHIPISRMVDFCESYSPFHACLTLRSFAHLVYASSHERTYGQTNMKKAITLAKINHPWNRYNMRMLIALFMLVWPYVRSHILYTHLVICLLSHLFIFGILVGYDLSMRIF
jgi:hypothetical protein